MEEPGGVTERWIQLSEQACTQMKAGAEQDKTGEECGGDREAEPQGAPEGSSQEKALGQWEP